MKQIETFKTINFLLLCSLLYTQLKQDQSYLLTKLAEFL